MMSAAQYEHLIDKIDRLDEKVTESRDLSKENRTKIDSIGNSLVRVDEAVFGNSHPGLRTRMDLLEQKVRAASDSVKSQLGEKIDWKWVGMLLLQAILLAMMADRLSH